MASQHTPSLSLLTPLITLSSDSPPLPPWAPLLKSLHFPTSPQDDKKLLEAYNEKTVRAHNNAGRSSNVYTRVSDEHGDYLEVRVESTMKGGSMVFKCSVEDEWLVQHFPWSRTKSDKLYVKSHVGEHGESFHRMVLPTVSGVSVDHINRDASDNRRDNLRPSIAKTQSINKSHPKQPGSMPLPNGIYFGDNAYRVSWQCNGRRLRSVFRLNEMDEKRARRLAFNRRMEAITTTPIYATSLFRCSEVSGALRSIGRQALEDSPGESSLMRGLRTLRQAGYNLWKLLDDGRWVADGEPEPWSHRHILGHLSVLLATSFEHLRLSSGEMFQVRSEEMARAIEEVIQNYVPTASLPPGAFTTPPLPPPTIDEDTSIDEPEEIVAVEGSVAQMQRQDGTSLEGHDDHHGSLMSHDDSCGGHDDPHASLLEGHGVADVSISPISTSQRTTPLCSRTPSPTEAGHLSFRESSREISHDEDVTSCPGKDWESDQLAKAIGGCVASMVEKSVTDPTQVETIINTASLADVNISQGKQTVTKAERHIKTPEEKASIVAARVERAEKAGRTDVEEWASIHLMHSQGSCSVPAVLYEMYKEWHKTTSPRLPLRLRVACKVREFDNTLEKLGYAKGHNVHFVSCRTVIP